MVKSWFGNPHSIPYQGIYFESWPSLNQSSCKSDGDLNKWVSVTHDEDWNWVPSFWLLPHLFLDAMDIKETNKHMEDDSLCFSNKWKKKKERKREKKQTKFKKTKKKKQQSVVLAMFPVLNRHTALVTMVLDCITYIQSIFAIAAIILDNTALQDWSAVWMLGAGWHNFSSSWFVFRLFYC